MSVSLLDIGRLTTTVHVRGAALEVAGISARDLFSLLNAFPELRRLMTGGVETRPEQLFEQVPGAVTAVIAYVCGYREYEETRLGSDGLPVDISKQFGDYQKVLDAINNLTLGEQAEIVQAAWALTFPRGFGPFLEALEAMGVGNSTGPTKGPATTSQERSRNSLPQDTQPETFGDTPPDSSAPSPS